MDNADHLQMMQSPGEWGNWPVLPVKRYRDGQMQVGCMFEGPGEQAKPTVHLVNMWDLRNVDTREVERLEYSDLEEVVNDGWQVD